MDDDLMVCLLFQLIDEAHGGSQCGTTGVPVSNGELRGRRRLLWRGSVLFGGAAGRLGPRDCLTPGPVQGGPPVRGMFLI